MNSSSITSPKLAAIIYIYVIHNQYNLLVAKYILANHKIFIWIKCAEVFKISILDATFNSI